MEESNLLLWKVEEVGSNSEEILRDNGRGHSN